MIELKPCPFCGSDEIDFQWGTTDREGTPLNAYCFNCGVSGPWIYTTSDTEFKAVEAWNKRYDVK